MANGFGTEEVLNNNGGGPEKETIEFSIPDFYYLFDLNMNLLALMRNNPELFRDNVKITSVYGTFPGCMWNSCHQSLGQATYENIASTVMMFNSAGISVRFTFNNSEVQGCHLMDIYCNEILKITSQVKSETGVENGVIIKADILDNHITKSFPQFYHVWSDTKSFLSIDDLNKLSEDRLTSLPYDMNNSKLLDEIKHPENIEVSVNNPCIEMCPHRAAHYAEVGKLQLHKYTEGFMCPFGCENYFYYDTLPERGHFVTMDYINAIYIPRKITKFKILGRGDSPINVIESYVNYFAKPEQRDNVRNKLLIMHFNGIKYYSQI